MHARKRVEVMDSHFVERPEVDAKAEGAIVLLDEVGFRNPIVGGRNDNTFGEHVGDGRIDAIVVGGERRRVAMRIGVASLVRMACCTGKETVEACVGWRVSDGKRANNWRMETNRSCGLRAT